MIEDPRIYNEKKLYWENWRAICIRMKLDYYLIPHTKLTQNLFECETWIKYIEENTDTTLIDNSHRSYFLWTWSQMQVKQRKNKLMGLYQTKNFHKAKETINKTKKQPTKWGRIERTNKTQQQKNSIKNGQRTWIDTFPKKT